MLTKIPFYRHFAMAAQYGDVKIQVLTPDDVLEWTTDVNEICKFIESADECSISTRVDVGPGYVDTETMVISKDHKGEYYIKGFNEKDYFFERWTNNYHFECAGNQEVMLH